MRLSGYLIYLLLFFIIIAFKLGYNKIHYKPNTTALRV